MKIVFSVKLGSLAVLCLVSGFFFFSFFFFFLRLRWSFCTSYSFLHNSFLVARSGPKLFQFSLYTIRFVTTFCVLLGNFCALKDYWHLHFCGQIEIIDYYNHSAVSQETGSAGSQWSASQNRCHKWQENGQSCNVQPKKMNFVFKVHRVVSALKFGQ